MTKVTYEIYDVKTNEVVLTFTDYHKMLKTLEETRETYREAGEYCPLSYRQVYTPTRAEVGEKNYIDWYRNGVPQRA